MDAAQVMRGRGEGWACYAGTMINDCLADMKDTSNELIKSTATSANGILS